MEDHAPSGPSGLETSLKPMTPIPFNQMAMVVLLQVAECVNVNVLFPFIAFMVEDLGYSGRLLGTRTGMLAGAFCFAQFTSSFMWGYIADKFGRKPTIIFGTLGASVGMMVFGLSKTYTQAMLGRIIAGFLNGNLGVVKTFLTEVTDDTNRSYGFSLISLAWSTGTVVAPVIGGLLCNPADKYPGTFSKDGLFGTYPYFLPCMLCVINSIVCATIVYFVMEETLDRKSDSVKIGRDDEIRNRPVVSTADMPYEAVSTMSTHGSDAESLTTYDEERSALHPSSDTGIVGESELDGIELTSQEARLIKKLSNMIERNGDEEGSLLSINSNSNNDNKLDNNHDNSVTNNNNSNAKISNDDEICCPTWHQGSKYNVLRQKLIVLATGNYALIAMAYVLLDETMPLILKLDESHGGFSFGSGDIGALLSIAGVLMVVFNYFVLPKLTKLGVRRVFTWGVLGSLPVVLFLPALSKINISYLSKLSESAHFYVFWGLLIAFMTCKNIMATLSFTAVMLQVNHSAAAEDLGKANGLGQSLASLARSIGPALGGFLWSMTIRYDFIYLNFIAFCVISISSLFNNALLPPSIEQRKMSRPS